jgi:RND family efflux transporter MFP subunit
MMNKALFLVLGLLLTPVATALEILDCVIEAQQLVNISSATAGVLNSVLVERNDTVHEGQLIAELQSGVEKANVELAQKRADSTVNIQDRQARYELSLRNQQRKEKSMLSEVEVDESRTQTVVAKFEIEKAKMEHEIDQLELQRAKEILNQRLIFSPVDGIVVERFKSAGEYVDQQAILALAQVNPLNVEVVAPISLFGRIKAGMRARIFPEQPIGGEHDAEVVIVDQIVDASSGTFGIRLHLSNQDYEIPAGLGCRIDFDLSR